MATFQKRGSRWRAIVRKKGHPAQSKTFTTKGMAQTWAREVERDIERGEFRDPRVLNGMTLGTLVDRYRAELPEQGRTKTACLNMLSRELGEVPLREITRNRIVEYGRKRAAEHGAGPATIAQDLIYLRGILDAAAKRWDLPVDVEAVAAARALLGDEDLVGRPEERDRRPTDDELAALRDYWMRPTSQPRVAPMWDIVCFAIASGMRLSEITGLRWADISAKDRTIVIRDRKHPSQKRGNHQTVPLLGEAWEIVQNQPKTADRIFPCNPRSISTNFTRAVMRCRIEDLHFHDLRHHAISLLFESGYGIPEVALISGHRDWKMLQRYVNLRAKDLHRTDKPGE